MRGSIYLITLTLAFAAVSSAQQPRVEDLHERLAKRLEQTIASQKKVLDDIRALLEESLRNQGVLDAERARLEIQADVERLKAQIAQQSADVKLLRGEVNAAKSEVEKLENRNHNLATETEALRSEIASQALHRQRLQTEVRQLRTIMQDANKKAEKREKGAPKPDRGAKKKDG